MVSHAYCYGSSHVDRRCILDQICFKGDTGQFVFFNDDESTYHGVPGDRSDPGFVSLSSISYHNQYLFDYVDVASSQYESLSSKYLVEWIHGHTYLYGRFKPDNLMHVLHDDLFPLLYSIQVTKDDTRVFFLDQWTQNMNELHSNCPVCFSAYKSLLPWQVDMNHWSDSWSNKLLCMDRVHVGVSRDTIWYDYGFYSPQKPVHHESIYLRETIDRLMKRINSQFTNDLMCKEKPVLVITRTRIRLILNLERILSLLTQFGLTYKTIRIENYSNFTQLVDQVKCSRFLLGIHGSGLSLASFLPPGSGVLELFPYAIDPSKYTPYRTLCERLGLHYEFWVNLKKENTLTHADRPPELGGLKHLPLNVQEQIQSSQSVGEHLCCSDAQWLFRINQDTIVDSDSFSQVLMSMVEKTQKAIRQQQQHKDQEEHQHQHQHQHQQQQQLPKLEATIRHSSPGPVESLKCTRKFKNGTISWNSPWNLPFLYSTSSPFSTCSSSTCSSSFLSSSSRQNSQYSQVIYEVNIQSSVTGEKRVSFTPDTEMTLSLFSPQSFIWVRCILTSSTPAASAKGPYNSKMIIC